MDNPPIEYAYLAMDGHGYWLDLESRPAAFDPTVFRYAVTVRQQVAGGASHTGTVVVQTATFLNPGAAFRAAFGLLMTHVFKREHTDAEPAGG